MRRRDAARDLRKTMTPVPAMAAWCLLAACAAQALPAASWAVSEPPASRPPEQRPIPPAAGDTLRLTLEACLDRALSVGEEIKQAQADRATAQARYLQARSTALPQITLSSSYTRQIQSIFQGEGGGFQPFQADTTKPELERIRDLEKALPTAGYGAIIQLLSSSSFASENAWNAALGVQQKIFQGGSIWASIEAAGHAMRSARMMEEDKRADVVLTVRQAYLGALLADRGVQISELGLEQAESHLSRVRLRQGAGTASEFELLQSEVERDNQLPQIKRARSVQELAYLEVRRLCNLPANVPLVLQSRLLEDSAAAGTSAAPDTSGLVEAAMETSGITALSEALAARGHAITVAEAGRYPSLNAFANFSQQAFPASVWPNRREWLRSENAGLSLSWNLFDGFLTKGQVQEAQSNRSRAALDLTNARELVRQAVIRQRWELTRSAADLEARKQTVRMSRRALELANLRYEQGASSLLEVSDVRIAWQIAQSDEAQARHDYFAALAALERYTGRRLFPANQAGGRQ